MDIYDCSESLWGLLQQHPFLTVLVIEPITFTVAIYLIAYALRLQDSLRWHSHVGIGYITKVIVLIFSCLVGATLGMIGLISGAVIAKGLDGFAHMLFIYAPLVVGYIIFRLIIKEAGYKNINSYINNRRY